MSVYIFYHYCPRQLNCFVYYWFSSLWSSTCHIVRRSTQFIVEYLTRSELFLLSQDGDATRDSTQHLNLCKDKNVLIFAPSSSTASHPTVLQSAGVLTAIELFASVINILLLAMGVLWAGLHVYLDAPRAREPFWSLPRFCAKHVGVNVCINKSLTLSLIRGWACLMSSSSGFQALCVMRLVNSMSLAPGLGWVALDRVGTN